jgi:hypothetical protein
MTKRERLICAIASVLLGLVVIGPQVWAQVISSGATVFLGAGSNLAGKFSTDQTTHGTTDLIADDLVKVAGATIATAASGIPKVGLTDGTGTAITSTGAALDINIKSGSIANTAFALNAGSAIIGFVRELPSGCGLASPQQFTVTQVATGAGSTLTSTTTCVTYAYVNNITNSAVTLRLADKQGSPVIWLGGNNDFTIPANSALRIPVDGVTFTSGITAIAGTSSALNLQLNGVQ